MKFKVANVNCQSCVNLIKNSLEKDFGKIDVDLSVNPRVLDINLEPSKEESFKKELDELGFEVLGRLD